MDTFFSENSENENNIFFCNFCNYKCSHLQHWKQHILTKKHKINIFNGVENSVNQTDIKYFKCVCEKTYRDRSGLWRHKKRCTISNISTNTTPTNNTQITTELVLKLIEQNKELQQSIIDQNKELQQTVIELSHKASTSNTMTNCGNNNKTFNLQVFLNETCKDAINMSDFVDQIQVSLSELEDTGRLGYAEGISKVFIKNLNDINDQERPLHCSDSKREIIYIKENNQWTKDDENKSCLMKAIKQVAHKNIKQITEWQKAHPNCLDPESKDNDKYMKIVLNSMSGSTQEEADKNYEKIARNITKNVVINKTNL